MLIKKELFKLTLPNCFKTFGKKGMGRRAGKGMWTEAGKDSKGTQKTSS